VHHRGWAGGCPPPCRPSRSDSLLAGATAHCIASEGGPRVPVGSVDDQESAESATLCCFVPTSLKERLTAKARDEDRSLSAEIRIALRRHLERYPDTYTGER
jgi:TraY domain